MHFKINHPSTANDTQAIKYIKSITLYMIHCMKYPTKISQALFKRINDQIGEIDY